MHTDKEAIDRLHREFRELGYTTNSQTYDLLEILFREVNAAKAAAWQAGFNAGHDWRQSTDEFWRTHDAGVPPTPPVNPYSA